MKTHDIKLTDGRVIKLRLTTRALNDFLEQVGGTDAPPIVSVVGAVNNLSARVKLFTAALNYSGAPDGQITDGADLIDELVDDGKDDAFMNNLVVDLARDCGLIGGENYKGMLNAVNAFAKNTTTKIVEVLADTAEAVESYSAPKADDTPM